MTLPQPPALNPEVGASNSCVVFNNESFTLLINKSAWFDLRSSLWIMATSLSYNEDISVSSNNCRVVPKGAVIVPYCEITLIQGDQPSGRFLKIKRNYLYRPEHGRVDFTVVRSEAEQAFLASESLGENNRSTMLFHNLWAEIVDDA